MQIDYTQLLNRIKRELQSGILTPDEYIQVLRIDDLLIDWYHVDYVARAEFAADADALQKYEDTRPLLESAPVAAVLAELERLAADGYKELSIGGKISVWRQMRLLTQAELAAKIGTTRQMLGQYEADRHVPGTARLIELANALEIKITDLI
mgnify:CR=1 FL=1